ncbi:MAG: thioredoxin domain-containing protein [Nannocystaceae bacterium]
MRRHLVASLLLVALGCDGSSPPPAAKDAPAAADAGAVTPPAADSAAADPAAADPATPAADPAAVANADAAAVAVATAPVEGDPCSAASFAMPKGTIIGTVNGEPLRSEDLGPEAAEAERDALRQYCGEVHKIREAASQRAVEERLLTTAARTEGVTADAYLRGQMQAKVAEPSDAEVEAFYEANKTEQAPPFDQVKGQVAEAMIKERSRAAYEELMGGLRKAATIELALPDVRPPPVDLSAAAHTATFGPADAKVQLVEFSDFECPYCARAAMGVQAVKDRFGDKVQVSYRHFPLSFHPAAQPAAEMTQCAQEQGKFWELHDQIFGSKDKLSAEGLRGLAEQAGLDMAKLDSCLASGRPQQQVAEDMAKGQEVGVRGTPSFYINGRSHEGGTSPSDLIAAIEAELAGS